MELKKKLKENIWLWLPIVVICLGIVGLFAITGVGFTHNDLKIFTDICKRMRHGDVLYRDVIDWKGPMLFFIWLPFSYLGKYAVLTMSVVVGSLLYYMLYKITQVHDFKLKKPILMMFLATILISTPGGLLVMPEGMTNLSLLWFLLMYDNDKIYSSRIVQVFAGVIVGLLFWSKMTLCLIFFPIYGFLLYDAISKKKVPELVKSCALSLVGFATISLLVCSYFVATDSLSIMLDEYFVSNSGYIGRTMEDKYKVLVWVIACAAYAIQLVACIIRIVKLKKFDMICAIQVGALLVCLCFTFLNYNQGVHSWTLLLTSLFTYVEYTSWLWVLPILASIGMAFGHTVNEACDDMSRMIQKIGTSTVNTLLSYDYCLIDKTMLNTDGKYTFFPRIVTENRSDMVDAIITDFTTCDAEYYLVTLSITDLDNLTEEVYRKNLLCSTSLTKSDRRRFIGAASKYLAENFEVEDSVITMRDTSDTPSEITLLLRRK